MLKAVLYGEVYYVPNLLIETWMFQSIHKPRFLFLFKAGWPHSFNQGLRRRRRLQGNCFCSGTLSGPHKINHGAEDRQRAEA